MKNAKGFTFIELLIALFIAAMISVALAIVFRTGMSFVGRSRAFYRDLQETLAVISHLRRTVAAASLTRASGDEGLVLFQSDSPGASASGLRCLAQDERHWRLESITIPVKKGKDANTPAQVPSTNPGGRSVSSSGEMAGAPAGNPSQANLDLGGLKSTVLLDELDVCNFEFLTAVGDTSKVSRGQVANDAPPVTVFEWSADRGNGSLVSLRINLATAEMTFPPVVFSSAK